ncbi:glycine-rich domain-containing protein [Pseudomonas protegens]|uniref:glycine-rich domain-containing protein n=1 Tax=Pseudomonas protegens TaxID=380021 RepID=UPI002779055F|nr:hypothetical protein [Pseudomonas protegens]MDP9528468.1 hypothetical protein [Pseudomonas protegens]
MDRQIVYPGQILPETTLLQMAKDAMIGNAKLASAMLGTGTIASGFAVTPTGPASLQVVVAPGEIYSLANIDSLAFSTLPADTAHSILKQGIMLDSVTLSCPAPTTTGQSINYLVQVAYQDQDSAPVLLPYYNSANPALPYSGMGNNGQTQNTSRKGVAIVQAKPGASAATGSQVTPPPDSGYVGLYVVSVAFGQAAITASNISIATGAPFINSTLHGLSPVFSVPPVVPAATQSLHAMQLGQATGRLIRITPVLATGTHTFSSDATRFVAFLVGGGGGGGGAAATTSSQYSMSGGGGGATFAVGIYSVPVSKSIAVTIGAGGIGGTGNTAGGNGGATSVGSLLSAPGGYGSVGASATSNMTMSGGSQISDPASGSELYSSRGEGGITGLNLYPGPGLGGSGGGTTFGPGPKATTNAGGAGVSAANFGSGGSGVTSFQSFSAGKGGDGRQGLVIIVEYT